jgi:hypothetical protein
MVQKPKELTIDSMKKELFWSGILFFTVGVVFTFLYGVPTSTSTLTSILGGFAIPIGILNLTVKARSMFVLNGIVFLAFGLVLFKEGDWYNMSLIVLFGILEFVNYGKYANVE